jgi:type IV secretory pathway TrbL component
MNRTFFIQFIFYLLIIIGFLQLFLALFQQATGNYQYDLGYFIGRVILSLILLLLAWGIHPKWIRR